MAHQEKRAKRDPVVVLHDDLVALPDGIKGGAKSIGRSAGVLHNKFSEAMPQYDITLRESLALAQVVREASGSTRFIESMCDEFDGVYMQLPQGNPAEDDVLQAYLNIVNSVGDLSREFTDARADGIIDAMEFASMKLRAHRSVAAIMHMLAELETMVREVPKPHLVASAEKKGA